MKKAVSSGYGKIQLDTNSLTPSYARRNNQSTIFLHWAVTANPIDIINQAKEIIMQTSTYQNVTGPTRTPSSAGP